MVQKSPDAFRTISEVAEILEIPAHVLRFWESRFTQIKPVKRGGGRRYYRPQDIDLLRGIRDLLYRDGMTIKGVQKILRERGVKHVAELGHLSPEEDPVLLAVTADAEVDVAAPPEPEAVEAEALPEPEHIPEEAPAEAAEEAVAADAERDDLVAEPEEEDRAAEEPVPAEAESNGGLPTSAEAGHAAPTAEEAVDEPLAAREEAPASLPVGRPFPSVDLPRPGRGRGRDVQVDLFAHAAARERRPFPPDPARQARAESLRGLLSKFEALRTKMASRS
ncbi:MerR family transcriptional regulator [Halovulum dunhuangense]|uniref:MerR family transcriptional regulator n=1 Tax=Halovulum dunhuangense TaxID=1505036 RepID=UPI0031B5DC68